MRWLWWLLLLLIPLIILIIPFRITVEFKEKLNLKLSILHISIYDYLRGEQKKMRKIHNYEEKKAEKTNAILAGMDLEETLWSLKCAKELLVALNRFLLKKVTFRQLKLNLSVGTGDAAKTALAVGTMNVAVYTLFSYVQENYTIKTYQVNVKPNFEEKACALHFEVYWYMNLWRLIRLFARESDALTSIYIILNEKYKKDGAKNER